MNLKYNAPLDPGFQPMEMVLRDFEARVKAEGGQRLCVALERNRGYCERFALDILPDGVDDELNCAVLERFIKTLLWVYGGWKIYICGSKVIYDHLDAAYRKGIELMMQNLLSILAGLKVQPMQSLGKCFNPDYHEAVSHVTDETAAEERIVQVVQTGFTMDEEVLRHAKVVVAN